MKLSSLSARPVSIVTNALSEIMAMALSTPDEGMEEVEGPTGAKPGARVSVPVGGVTGVPLHPQALWRYLLQEMTAST